jgi:spore coat polysaccharide biosynthesis protein SpsF
MQRNRGELLLASNLNFFSRSLRAARGVKTCIEFGANVGMNLKALKLLYPAQEQFGIEINAEAARELGQVIPPSHVFTTSILDFNTQQTWDLALIKGVLIHINPDALPQVYDKLVAAAARC